MNIFYACEQIFNKHYNQPYNTNNMTSTDNAMRMQVKNTKIKKIITPFYISNADFKGIKKIKKYKINSRNFTYDGLTFSSSVFILEEVKDEI